MEDLKKINILQEIQTITKDIEFLIIEDFFFYCFKNKKLNMYKINSSISLVYSWVWGCPGSGKKNLFVQK